MSKEIKKKSEIQTLFNISSIKKILFITGKNSFNKTGAKEYFEKELFNKEKFFFFKKSYTPQFEEAVEMIKYKEQIAPDLIIAIGGGCVMDYAKIISNFNYEKKLKDKIINSDLNKISRNKIKLIAIPTTAGSGAEVTSNAVIYINNLKYSVEGSGIKPDYFFLEPKFLQSTSLITDSSSGFDAISQAVESLFSLRSNEDSVNFSKKSLKILLNNYPNFIKNKNLENSYNMALGANLAGRAISISKTTLPHAMSYPFTINYGVPHGHAVSLTFNKFLKFNYINMEKNISEFSLKNRFEILFKLTNTNNIEELDNFFNLIKKEAYLEQDMIKLGINLKKDISKILDGINDQRLKNNPIKVKKKDLEYILREFN
jgi:alcohol dehydrogenase class IV